MFRIACLISGSDTTLALDRCSRALIDGFESLDDVFPEEEEAFAQWGVRQIVRECLQSDVLGNLPVALAHLGHRDRAALVLCDVDFMPYKKIAEVLDSSEEVIRRRILESRRLIAGKKGNGISELISELADGQRAGTLSSDTDKATLNLVNAMKHAINILHCPEVFEHDWELFFGRLSRRLEQRANARPSKKEETPIALVLLTIITLIISATFLNRFTSQIHVWPLNTSEIPTIKTVYNQDDSAVILETEKRTFTKNAGNLVSVDDGLGAISFALSKSQNSLDNIFFEKEYSSLSEIMAMYSFSLLKKSRGGQPSVESNSDIIQSQAAFKDVAAISFTLAILHNEILIEDVPRELLGAVKNLMNSQSTESLWTMPLPINTNHLSAMAIVISSNSRAAALWEKIYARHLFLGNIKTTEHSLADVISSWTESEKRMDIKEALPKINWEEDVPIMPFVNRQDNNILEKLTSLKHYKLISDRIFSNIAISELKRNEIKTINAPVITEGDPLLWRDMAVLCDGFIKQANKNQASTKTLSKVLSSLEIMQRVSSENFSTDTDAKEARELLFELCANRNKRNGQITKTIKINGAEIQATAPVWVTDKNKND